MAARSAVSLTSQGYSGGMLQANLYGSCAPHMFWLLDRFNSSRFSWFAFLASLIKKRSRATTREKLAAIVPKRVRIQRYTDDWSSSSKLETIRHRTTTTFDETEYLSSRPDKTILESLNTAHSTRDILRKAEFD